MTTVSFSNGSMTPAQARLIDPILTTHALEYVRPENVGQKLFPIAPVDTYGGQVIEFGKEAFRRYNSKRAPGANVASIVFGYLGKPYNIASNALDAKIPHEVYNDANRAPGLDLSAVAVNRVLDSLKLSHEYDCAELARDVANYDADHRLTLSSTTLWSASTGKPTDDIENAKEAVRTSTGNRANTVLLSASAYKRCKTNAQIVDRLRYTSAASVTREMLAKLWEVDEVVVGDAVGASGPDDEFSDVWGSDVIVAYVPKPTSKTTPHFNGTPSYGYTYAMRGHPMVRKARYEEGCLSWLIGVSFDQKPVLSGMLAGFLIQNAGQ
jgi:hypothetical protein